MVKYLNVILTVELTLHDTTHENVKCDMNIRIKIKKSSILHALLDGVNFTICKPKKKFYHIPIAVKHYFITNELNAKIHHHKEYAFNVA